MKSITLLLLAVLLVFVAGNAVGYVFGYALGTAVDELTK